MTAAANNQFSNTTTDYSDVTGVAGGAASSATTWTDPGRGGDGHSYYYRVVPGDVAQDQIFGSRAGVAYNKRTAGKIDVALAQGYNALSYPFNTASIDIPTMIGNQLSVLDQIHWWNRTSQQYSIITKNGAAATAWNATHTFNLSESFFVYIVPAAGTATPRAVNLTLVGLVDNFTPGLRLPLSRQYNLLGYPYPMLRIPATAGFAPREGDQIHIWYSTAVAGRAAQRFGIATYVRGAWNNPDMVNFTVGEGKFYYIPLTNSAYDWVPTF
jgi:hypothetical protein